MEDEPTVRMLEANQCTLDDALDTFTRDTHRVILNAGKTPVVWQEMVCLFHPLLFPLSQLTWIR
jgi:hexosaminidase